MSKKVQVIILQGLAGKETFIKGKEYALDAEQAKNWEAKGLCMIIQPKRKSNTKTNKSN